MLSSRLQRHLAVAGLSVVTGSAAIGIAIVGVGPLGEVAASVRGAGASFGRSVLSVVVPDEPGAPEAAPPQASPQADEARPPATRRAPSMPVQAAPRVPRVDDAAPPSSPPATGLPVPPITSSPGEDGGLAEVDELVTAPSPRTEASQAPPQATVTSPGVAAPSGLAGDTLR